MVGTYTPKDCSPLPGPSRYAPPAFLLKPVRPANSSYPLNAFAELPQSGSMQQTGSAECAEEVDREKELSAQGNAMAVAAWGMVGRCGHGDALLPGG